MTAPPGHLDILCVKQTTHQNYIRVQTHHISPNQEQKGTIQTHHAPRPNPCCPITCRKLKSRSSTHLIPYHPTRSKMSQSRSIICPSLTPYHPNRSKISQSRSIICPILTPYHPNRPRKFTHHLSYPHPLSPDQIQKVYPSSVLSPPLITRPDPESLPIICPIPTPYHPTRPRKFTHHLSYPHPLSPDQTQKVYPSPPLITRPDPESLPIPTPYHPTRPRKFTHPHPLSPDQTQKVYPSPPLITRPDPESLLIICPIPTPYHPTRPRKLECRSTTHPSSWDPIRSRKWERCQQRV